MKAAAAPETATIGELDQDGRGVARIDGKTAFVAGALPGEQVLLRRTRRHRRYDEAIVLEVLVPSPARVAPRCRHFGVCGGCVLQHMAPSAQLEMRQRQVAESLERIGGVQPGAWLPPLAGPVWAYRRRARLGCRYVAKKGRVLVGFREQSSPLLADLERCEILVEPVGGLIAPLAALIGELDIRGRVAQIEVAAGTGVTVLVLRVLEEPGPEDCERLRAFAVRHGVEFWLQPGGLDTVRPLSSGSSLRYGLPGLDHGIEFEPTDFIQVNDAINQAMVARALELLAPQPRERVLDLFCGLGNFSLPLARRAAWVTGVEGDAALVARARDNARRNGISNVTFQVADLAACTAADRAREPHELVLLDPPRAGAREALPLVTSGRPRRIVYVSCHPGTLARDAGLLAAQHGYRLVAAGVMDMFPHTAHVETIAMFEPA